VSIYGLVSAGKVRAATERALAAEDALRKVVAAADSNPFCPIGHVIEHVVPEARALTEEDRTDG
jgi:hypothetical protein